VSVSFNIILKTIKKKLTLPTCSIAELQQFGANRRHCRVAISSPVIQVLPCNVHKISILTVMKHDMDIDQGSKQEDRYIRLIVSASHSTCSLVIISHTRTVVRECYKDDGESLWKSLKFDHSPR